MKIIDYKDKASFANGLRRKRIAHVIALMQETYGRQGFCKVLDVGGTLTYWENYPAQILRDLKVKITVVNLKVTETTSDTDIFELQSGDACNMPMFADASFDIVHSNSVIEHVGDWKQMQKMSNEIRRIGQSYYVQTPYFWFPIEPHFVFPVLHWLPMSWRYRIAMSRALGSWVKAPTISDAIIGQQSAILLDGKMAKALFPDANQSWEYFLGFRKSILMIRRVPT